MTNGGISLHQRVINEPGRANWAINSPVAEEDCYLLANARASCVPTPAFGWQIQLDYRQF